MNLHRVFLFVLTLLILSACANGKKNIESIFGDYSASGRLMVTKMTLESNKVILYTNREVIEMEAEYITSDDGQTIIILPIGEDEVIVLRKNGSSLGVHVGGNIEARGILTKI